MPTGGGTVLEILLDEHIGKIVSSTNKYNDLYDQSTRRIDEAVPVVRICNKEYDKAIFGVISGEECDEERIFSLGHISFQLQKENSRLMYRATVVYY